MIVRDCTGGIVFDGDSVLMLENDKHEWVFPKGVIRPGQKITEVAVNRIKIEAGIDAKILCPCGKTNYEFYSVSRCKPVHNNVSWFVMKALNKEITVDESEDFINGGFFPIEDAIKKITYSQDKTLLMVAYQRFKELG